MRSPKSGQSINPDHGVTWSTPRKTCQASQPVYLLSEWCDRVCNQNLWRLMKPSWSVSIVHPAPLGHSSLYSELTDSFSFKRLTNNLGSLRVSLLKFWRVDWGSGGASPGATIPFSVRSISVSRLLRSTFLESGLPCLANITGHPSGIYTTALDLPTYLRYLIFHLIRRRFP